MLIPVIVQLSPEKAGLEEWLAIEGFGSILGWQTTPDEEATPKESVKCGCSAAAVKESISWPANFGAGYS